MSCISGASCLAVGFFMATPAARLALVERWDGKQWSIQPSPKPEGAIGSLLNDVTCWSSRECFAVGTFTSHAGQHVALIEHWNGVRWRIQSIPRVTGATAVTLNGVSCVSAHECIVVGSETNQKLGQAPLVLRWNGHGWSLGRSPTGDPLSSVSCTSRAFCVAVGGSSVIRWNGVRWDPAPIGNLSQGTSFAGVSCTSRTFCMVVAGAMTEGWNGRSWTARPVSKAPPGVALDAVSCVSSSSCMGVGSLDTEVPCSGSCGPYYTATTLQVEHWDGRRWTYQRTPNPNSEASLPSVSPSPALTGVSCAKANVCIAVGPYTNGQLIPVAFAERWDGAKWKVQQIPSAGGAVYGEESTLDGISCTSATRCIAVGSSLPGDTDNVLVEGWNHGRWSIQQAPLGPGNAGEEALEAISCMSATSCMAIGTTGNEDGQTLSESWNGTRWAIEQTPTPPGASAESGAELYAISCRSTKFCMAVGDYFDRNANDFLLAERWDGRRWSVERTPDASGADSPSGGVSCASTESCMLVEGARTEHWDGTKWAIVPTPNDTQLAGVSCTSLTHCVAVGELSASPSSPSPSPVEVWNGHSWKVQPTPTLAGATASLSSISCLSQMACTAVGTAVPSAGSSVRQYTLAEHWNGRRWTVLPIPNSSARNLSSVTCTSTLDCVAVGSGGGAADNGIGVVAEGYP